MSMRNVGIVFSPTLNIPTPVLSMFLSEFESIFREPPEDTGIPPVELAGSEPLTPEDIRSPRRQMFSDIPTPSYTQETFSNNTHQFTNNHHNIPAFEESLLDSRMDNDTGFIPLQPAYENLGSQQVPGPAYAVARPRNLQPGGPAKARRRESTMVIMGSGPGPGQRTSPLPSMRNDSGKSIFVKSTFDVSNEAITNTPQICYTKKVGSID